MDLSSLLAAVRSEISPHLEFLGQVEQKAVSDLEAAERDFAAWVATLATAGTPAVRDQLATIGDRLACIEQQLEKIMSEDAAVQAATADILADEQAITTALGTIQAAVTAALADAVQPSTLSALQSAQAALDTLTQTATADAASDEPPAPPAS